jgi:signal peptidase II
VRAVQDRRAGPALTRLGAAHRITVVAAVAAVVVAGDQLAKAWAVDALDDGRTIDLVWTLRLRLVFNRGGAFGLATRLAPFFALAAVTIVLVLFRAGAATRDRWALVAIGLVAGGALGNLSDRVFRDGKGLLGGAVVDFVDVQWWPVFNVADSCIVVGAILLALVLAREPAGSTADGAGTPDGGLP